MQLLSWYGENYLNILNPGDGTTMNTPGGNSSSGTTNKSIPAETHLKSVSSASVSRDHKMRKTAEDYQHSPGELNRSLRDDDELYPEEEKNKDNLDELTNTHSRTKILFHLNTYYY